MRASEWAFDRIKEAFDLVAKDEVEKMSIVQEITLTSTANPCDRQRTRRCHNVLLVPELQQFLPGRLRSVGLCWEEVHQLVVCELW